MSNGWLIPASSRERQILVAQAEQARRQYEWATQRLRQLDIVDDMPNSTKSAPMNLGTTQIINPSVTAVPLSYTIAYPSYSNQSAHGNIHKQKQDSVYLGLNDDHSHSTSQVNRHYGNQSAAPSYKISQSAAWQNEYEYHYGSAPGSINSHWMPQSKYN